MGVKNTQLQKPCAQRKLQRARKTGRHHLCPTVLPDYLKPIYLALFKKITSKVQVKPEKVGL